MSRTIDIIARAMAKNGGGKVSDIKVDGQSIVNEGQANLATRSPYDPEQNPLATMEDVGGGGSQEVLSNIKDVTSEGRELLIFPAGIYPLAYYSDDVSKTYYFNYVKEKVYADNGQGNPKEVGAIRLHIDENGKVCICFDITDEGFAFDTNCDAVAFCSMDAGEDYGLIPALDAWAMAFPPQESKPNYVGYKFKDDITDPSQVHILFTVDEGDGAGQYTPDDPHEEESDDTHTVITRIGYVNGRPALFNPDPEDGGEDCWYLYSGTMELDGTVYDKWFAPCDEYPTESGVHVYYRLSNAVVNPQTIENQPAPSGGESHMYLHTIRISAWDDTVPGGMGCDDIEFIFRNNVSAAYNQNTFREFIATSAGYHTVAWSQCPLFMCGSEDSHYYNNILADIEWNSTQSCFKATLYNSYGGQDEIHPILKNVSGFSFEDEVVQLW